MSSDVNQIDEVFRLIDREVWIVTSATVDRRGGLTATWVSQASIDASRPIVLIGLAPNHFTSELVDASGAFALHLLGADQVDVAWNFANRSGRSRDKLADLTFHTGSSGSPLLNECMAWLDCQVFAHLVTGDRTYYWADVVAGQACGADDASRARPLTEHQFFQHLSDEQRRQLKADRDRDISVQQSLLDAWRREMPDVLSWP